MNNRYLLVADNNISTRSFLQETLQKAGYETKSVASGDECLRLSFSNERPSLIILGWQMPVLTGLEILTLLKVDERSKSIPVIMVSTEQGDEEQALNTGAYVLLTKPLAIDSLLLHVQGALRLEEPRL
ncbi:response regulator [Desulfitobacterium sp.]|uniref:response regulator n=1 Tax=Desulfitobacterium sp. TaxID=49981 RepID=UPI002BC9B326|nr:response regulator [Desulfitobacterium sp.]HVJ49776.1 response regulator [Desulfitobacterium sp.]